MHGRTYNYYIFNIQYKIIKLCYAVDGLSSKFNAYNKNVSYIYIGIPFSGF